MSQDKLGFTRPIFVDRLCDGISDCPENEDEGKLAKCKMAGELTPNGCCPFPIIRLYKFDVIVYRWLHIACAYTGNSNESGWFSNDFDSFLR